MIKQTNVADMRRTENHQDCSYEKVFRFEPPHKSMPMQTYTIKRENHNSSQATRVPVWYANAIDFLEYCGQTQATYMG